MKPEQTAANPSFCCICYYCCLVIKPPFADFVIPTKMYPSITAQRHHKTCPFFPPTFGNTLLNTGERMHRSISLLCVQDRARRCSAPLSDPSSSYGPKPQNLERQSEITELKMCVYSSKPFVTSLSAVPVSYPPNPVLCIL